MGNFDKKENNLRSISMKICGLIPALLGVTALFGWILDIPVLSTFLSGRIPMAPSSAILFILFGFIIFNLSSARINNRIGIVVSLAGTLIALLLFFLSINGIQSNIESFGVNINWTVGNVNAGHISPLTAIGFIFIGFSSLIIQNSKTRKISVIISFIISVLVIFSTTILTVSYLHGAPLFYGLNFIPPAFTSTVAFLILGLSILLRALEVWNYNEYYDKGNRRFIFILILIFVIFSIGIIFAGIKYYKNYERDLQKEIGNELSSVADLKAGEITQWRKERLNDGKVIYKNELFTENIKDYFYNKDTSVNKKKIETWLKKVQDVGDVETLILLDSQFTKRIVVPENNERSKAFISKHNFDSLKTGKIVFEDFYRNEPNQKIYLNVLVPVFDNKDTTKLISVVQIRIDPDVYLYPLISNWPLPTKTAETVILRLEGNEVVFLNELRSQKNTALKLRIPIDNEALVVVKAFKEKIGIVEGLDYNGNEVIANIKQIPNSPWVMLTSMDKADVFAPLKEAFQWTVLTIVLILFTVGSIISSIWKNQRTRFFKERYKSTEALRDSESKFRLLYEGSPVPYQSLDLEGKLIEVNNSWLEQLGYAYQEVIGHHIGEFIVEKDLAILQDLFPNYIKTGEMHNVEFDFKCKDGSLITYSINGKISYDLKGEFSQTHCVLHNITERKYTEEAILESEKLLKESQAIARLGSFVWNITTGVWKSSKILDEIFGINENYNRSLQGWIDIIHPECQETMNEYVAKDILDKHLRFDKEYKIIRQSDEQICWVHGLAELELDKNNNPVKLIGTISDITNRKKAEEEIIKLNRVYKVLSNVNQMIVRTTKADEILKDSCNIAVTDGEFRMAWIGALNKSENKIYIVASSGISEDYLDRVNIDLNDIARSNGPTGRSVKLGRHYVSNDIEHDDVMIPWREEALKMGYKSSASFPIKVFGETVYVYNLYSSEINFFDDDELKLLDELVTDISFALEFVEKEKERKHAEELLKVSEQKYKDIFSFAPMGIYQSTREGKFIKINTRFAEILGYNSIEEIMSLDMNKDIYFYEDEREKLINKYESNKDINNVEIKWKKKDGTAIWISLSSHIFHKDEGKIYFEGFVRDITDKKRYEKSIKASEEKYRNLIETMPEGFYRSTPEGSFVDVNPALVKMLGYSSKEEIMKVNIPETLYFTKDDRSDVVDYNISFVPDTDVYRLKKKDGSEIWIEDYARYIKDASGEIIFHEGIMRDITESLRAQKAIIKAKDKAEEMSRLKSSFLANMSHEIRTPLNGILGFAEILKSELKDDEHLNCVKIIEKGGRRLLETLDLILNYSKLEAEMVTALYNEVNVGSVINEVVNNFKAMAKNKNLFLKKEIKHENLIAIIDDRFLRHALNNLVKNAIVYTNKGGITVTFDKDENDMIIKVKDTGIGIAKENFEMIFEPFRQESEGYSRNFEGTGLGLSITKRFVEMMEGKIEVESEVGIGSTFTIKLPLIKNADTIETEIKKEEPVKTTAIPALSNKEKLSVLLVENDEDNRLFTSTVLNKYYKMDYAISGNEAIDMSRNKIYDIILMDINLGKGMDGIQATQEIRKLKGYKKTPIVALTAYAREGDKEEFLAGGCTHYLGKPFTVKQLLDLIENI